MEAEMDNLPVNETELQARMLEPEKNILEDIDTINRNLQLGNVKYRELFWLQALESESQNICKIPICEGGDIFNKWGKNLTLNKNHFLALSGSREGFVRKILRTTINKSNNNYENPKGGVSAFFNRKKGE